MPANRIKTTKTSAKRNPSPSNQKKGEQKQQQNSNGIIKKKAGNADESKKEKPPKKEKESIVNGVQKKEKETVGANKKTTGSAKRVQSNLLVKLDAKTPPIDQANPRKQPKLEKIKKTEDPVQPPVNRDFNLLDNILSQIEAFDTANRPNKKVKHAPPKIDSNSDDEEGNAPCSSRQLPPTPLPGSYRPLNKVELARQEHDNSMVQVFLHRDDLLERILAYKMLRGRVEPFSTMTAKIDLQNCIVPEYEVKPEVIDPLPEYSQFDCCQEQSFGANDERTPSTSGANVLQQKLGMGPMTPPGSPGTNRSSSQGAANFEQANSFAVNLPPPPTGPNLSESQLLKEEIKFSDNEVLKKFGELTGLPEQRIKSFLGNDVEKLGQLNAEDWLETFRATLKQISEKKSQAQAFIGSSTSFKGIVPSTSQQREETSKSTGTAAEQISSSFSRLHPQQQMLSSNCGGVDQMEISPESSTTSTNSSLAGTFSDGLLLPPPPPPPLILPISLEPPPAPPPLPLDEKQEAAEELSPPPPPPPLPQFIVEQKRECNSPSNPDDYYRTERRRPYSSFSSRRFGRRFSPPRGHRNRFSKVGKGRRNNIAPRRDEAPNSGGGRRQHDIMPRRGDEGPRSGGGRRQQQQQLQQKGQAQQPQSRPSTVAMTTAACAKPVSLLSLDLHAPQPSSSTTEPVEQPKPNVVTTTPKGFTSSLPPLPSPLAPQLPPNSLLSNSTIIKMEPRSQMGSSAAPAVVLDMDFIKNTPPPPIPDLIRKSLPNGTDNLAQTMEKFISSNQKSTLAPLPPMPLLGLQFAPSTSTGSPGYSLFQSMPARPQISLCSSAAVQMPTESAVLKTVVQAITGNKQPQQNQQPKVGPAATTSIRTTTFADTSPYGKFFN